MAEPEFGDPQTIQDLANAAMRVAADLRQLVELMNRDVEATVPDRWGGEGAGAFTRFWYRFQRSWSMPDTPLGRYADNLTRAAETMRQARSKLQEARAFADREGLEIGNDFRVVARNRNRPEAQALEAQGQELVNNARRMAQTAREQIAMANRILDEDARANIREMMQIKEAFDAARGYRGGPRRRPPTTLGIFGPEGRPRQPRPGLGRWTQGNATNGEWKPHNPDTVGIRPGQPDRIRWVQGTPDLRGHTVPAHELKGLNGHLDGLPLRGPTDRAYDVRLADQHMGIRYGFRDRPGETAGDQFRAFRRNNDYVWHHYSRHEVTLVDGRLHRSIGHQYYD